MEQSIVELSDILAVRLECTECHTALTLPLLAMIQAINIERLRRCPYCLNGWMPTQSRLTIEAAGPVTDLVESIQRFWRWVNSENDLKPGFTFSLVVKSRPRSPSDVTPPSQNAATG